MSGHSKWSQIKYKKGIADAKKGKVFGKLARLITIAARNNPDPATNARLKTEVERARAANMPSDNIERAIKRVSDKSQAALSEVQLELVGPAGVAIIVQAVTDNSNRTINEIKQLVSKMGARMAGQGAMMWMFQKTVGADGVEYTPTTLIPLPEVADQEKLHALLDALDDLDDVQNIATNADY